MEEFTSSPCDSSLAMSFINGMSSEEAVGEITPVVEAFGSGD